MALIKKTPSGTPAGSATPQQAGLPYEEPVASPDDAAFNAINEAAEFAHPAPGTYEALVNDIALRAPTEKGRSVQIQFILAVEDDETGEVTPRKHSAFWKVLEPDLRTAGGQAPFFATVMAKLGYERGKRGQAAFDQIKQEKPGVSVKITKNDPYPPNTTLMIRYVQDTENIIQLREWLEQNPF
jgi:hypothetical protein